MLSEGVLAKGEMLAYFDRTLDPFTNLAREEELFQGLERGELPELVRFWVDSECLVRSRARSARYGWYREAQAEGMGIKVIERTTGGGVVYHDEGNLNWSIFLRNSGPLVSPTRIFEHVSAYVIRALNGLGVQAQFAPPNRIDVRGRKISGMAARMTPRTILVHGTLLLRVDLEKLNRLCISPPDCPPVANLEEWVPGIEAFHVADALIGELRSSGFDVRTSGGDWAD